MGTTFNTRGRITIKGIERCTSEDEFLSCRSVGCYTLPFAFQMVGRHLLERLIPLSDKIPWPMRQKEASQITFPWVAIPVFPVGPCNPTWNLG